MKKTIPYVLLLIGFIWGACSSESNTWSSKAYHNLTAHYNGYYYALEEITKIEQTIQKSNVDDYNRVLRLFPTFDSTIAKSYEKEAEEAVKMASIAIQRHPNSRWVDDAYILVGKARLYTLDWGNAIQTFKFVNTKSKDPDARHKAIVSLVRTFTEHQEYKNALSAIDYLLKEKLSRENRKAALLEKAYYHQVLGDYDNMVRSLTQADPYLSRNDKRGRIYFIIGQVYQKLGFESEAYNYYRKCLSTNPEYEVDFYARLYMAQVAEISRTKDINAARRSFKKLLKDRKNKDFKDKIYYEMGIFELKQKNVELAVRHLNAALREGSNQRTDGEAYLRLGEIYYDTLRDYELSQAYYDSAIQALPKDYENYDAIKSRAEILNEFVRHLKTIQWQDSLLKLSSLDSAAIYQIADSVYAARKKQEEIDAKKKKKSNRVQLATTSSIFDNQDGMAGAGNWYFGNPSAVALGESEFKRVWGSIPLEDNWRRSQKTSEGGTSGNRPQPTAQSENQNADPAASQEPPADPVALEYENLWSQIPHTAEQKKEALKKIEDAYFHLGDIYYFRLLEKTNAVKMYETLLKRFPGSEHEPEVLYKLYLIFKENDPEKAEQYASRLKQDYPNSTYAKILINPNYLKEASETEQKQKDIYKEAYKNFQERNFVTASLLIKDAEALGQTEFSANLDLLKILITGQTEDISKYQFALQEFMAAHQGTDLATYAEKLLQTSRDLQATEERRKGIRYIWSFEGSHYFVIVYRQTEKLADIATRTLESFNNSSFPGLNLKTSNLSLNDEYALTMVSDIPTLQAAKEYYKVFNDRLPSLDALRNYKFNKFVITKDNFNIFYRTKGLDEYIRFFEKTYESENQ